MITKYNSTTHVRIATDLDHATAERMHEERAALGDISIASFLRYLLRERYKVPPREPAGSGLAVDPRGE